MKKIFYTFTIIAAAAIVLPSCRKDYHCYCVYNGQAMYSADLGTKYKANAQNDCNAHTNTVAGETWDCSID